MSGITLSAATRQNLLSLQDTANLLSSTQSRLSTGKKVNSALDNPTNFFTAQSLSARSSDISSLLDGISNGVQAIQAATQGITSITKLLETAKSTASQALADKSGGSSGITGGTTAQAAKVTGSATLANLGTTDAAGKTTFDLSSPSKDASLEITLNGAKSTIRLDSTTLAASGTDLTKVTSDQLLTAINGQIANNAALKDKVVASTSPDGRITFASTATGSSSTLTVAGSANSTIDIGYGKSTTPPTSSTVTAKTALAATTDFSTGSASLVVSDGNTSVQVRLDKNSKTDDLGGTLGTSASRADVAKAINKQLKDNGSTATVELSGGNNLVFKSADVGPDAQISVIGGLDTTGGNGAAGIGFSTFTASTPVAGVPAAASTLATAASTYVAPLTGTGSDVLVANVVAGSTGVAGKTTSSVTSAANIDLRGGKTATFVVGDGTNSRSVTLNENSFSGAAVPGNPTQTELTDAINSQLTGFAVQASFVGNKLTFTNASTGSGNDATVSASYDTIGLGFQTGGTSALNGTPPTTIVAGQSSSFTVNDGTKTTTISLDSTSLQLDGSAIGTTSSAAEFASAINRQLQTDGNEVTASVVGGKLTFTTNAVGSGKAAPTITQGTDALGLFGAPATTKSNATGNFPASLDLSSGQSASFSVDGTAVTITSASLDKNGTAIGSNPTQAKVLESINRQLGAQSATQNVTAYVDGTNKLTFARQGTAAGAVAAPVVTGVSDTTSGLGFGTANTLTATNAATTPAASTAAKVVAGGTNAAGTLTLSATPDTFQVGDGTTTATISISSASLDKSGNALTTSATQAKVAEAIQAQLDAQGVNVTAAYNNNKLEFTSKGLGTSGTVTLTPGTDGAGLSIGAAGAANLPQTATGVPAGSIDLSNGKSSAFTIGDGTNSKAVTISATSLDKSGTALGASATQAKIAEAIQAQLDASGVKATVSFQADRLQVKSNAVGTGAAAPTLSATSDTAGLGFGTTTTASSTPAAGGGSAAVGITASGTEATDGSSKASIVGAEQTVTKNFSGTKDASFTLKLGDGPLKLITLNNANLGTGTDVSQSAIAAQINKQINDDTGLNGKVEAKYVNNKLVISTTASGSDQKLAIQAAQVTTGGSTGVDIGFGVSGAGATSQTGAGTDVGGSKGTSSVRSALAKQYNQILQQITQQAQDSGYNGVNLLFRNSNNAADNTLHIAFNEKNTSALDIEGVRFDAAGLGLSTVDGGFQSDTDITAAIDKITTATTQLRTQSSTFGANLSVVQNRQDFSKNLINILDTGSANLTNADLNEEAANSQALSTRNSIATSALSLANQAQQGILQLLR